MSRHGLDDSRSKHQSHPPNTAQDSRSIKRPPQTLRIETVETRDLTITKTTQTL